MKKNNSAKKGIFLIISALTVLAFQSISTPTKMPLLVNIFISTLMTLFFVDMGTFLRIFHEQSKTKGKKSTEWHEQFQKSIWF
jgi:hypothetical protein